MLTIGVASSAVRSQTELAVRRWCSPKGQDESATLKALQSSSGRKRKGQSKEMLSHSKQKMQPRELRFIRLYTSLLRHFIT